MNKKTIKAKIAAALSASMVFTTLAPAMPAYAADGTLKFDFSSFNPSVERLLQHNIEFSGGVGTLIDAVIPGMSSNANHIVGLPYWKSAEVNGGSDNKFDKTVNIPKIKNNLFIFTTSLNFDKNTFSHIKTYLLNYNTILYPTFLIFKNFYCIFL